MLNEQDTPVIPALTRGRVRIVRKVKMVEERVVKSEARRENIIKDLGRLPGDEKKVK